MNKNGDIRRFFTPKNSSTTDPTTTRESVQEKVNSDIRSPTVEIYVFPAIPSYPSKLIVEPISSATIPSFKQLLSVTLPVPYTSKFFSHLSQDPSFCHLAFWNEGPQIRGGHNISLPPAPVVGGIKARLENLPGTSIRQLYIETLSLFAPYRGIGVGKCLLHELLQELRLKEPEGSVQSVYAHVWESNEDGLRWYLRQGFFIDTTLTGTENGLVKTFYRRLTPSGAWIVRLNIIKSDAQSQPP